MGKKRGKLGRDARAAQKSGRTVHAADTADLLNYEEAARFLGLKKHTLENWISTGLYSVPFVKLGGRVRFRRHRLLAWIQSREVGGQFIPQPTTESVEAR